MSGNVRDYYVHCSAEGSVINLDYLIKKDSIYGMDSRVMFVWIYNFYEAYQSCEEDKDDEY